MICVWSGCARTVSGRVRWWWKGEKEVYSRAARLHSVGVMGGWRKDRKLLALVCTCRTYLYTYALSLRYVREAIRPASIGGGDTQRSSRSEGALPPLRPYPIILVIDQEHRL